MGGRPPLEDHEIWEEWEKTKPTEDAKATLAEFFDRVADAQSKRGTAQVSGKDINELIIGVATERGFEPPNCGEFWNDRARRWTDSARIFDLTDLCDAYSIAADNLENVNLGNSPAAQDALLREVVAEWENKRSHQAQTKSFVDKILATPVERRGELFAADLKSFLKGYERKAIYCRELQEHLEALSKQSQGSAAGE